MSLKCLSLSRALLVPPRSCLFCLCSCLSIHLPLSLLYAPFFHHLSPLPPTSCLFFVFITLSSATVTTHTIRASTSLYSQHVHTTFTACFTTAHHIQLPCCSILFSHACTVVAIETAQLHLMLLLYCTPFTRPLNTFLYIMSQHVIVLCHPHLLLMPAPTLLTLNCQTRYGACAKSKSLPTTLQHIQTTFINVSSQVVEFHAVPTSCGDATASNATLSQRRLRACAIPHSPLPTSQHTRTRNLDVLHRVMRMRDLLCRCRWTCLTAQHHCNTT